MDGQQAKLLAAYNRSMNQQIFAVCANLPDDERRRDRQAFFRSIHGTLNHLLLVDRLWFGSFVGKPVSFATLDQELFADFDELRRERDVTDVKICEWAGDLRAAELNTLFKSGDRETGYPLWLVATHFFNHQTHHRGQVSVLLSQQGMDYGLTDLPWVPGVVEAIKN
jgi:uncharacterized damage-inducible protein DinB